MTLDIPALSLVALVGPTGCGKSTLARRLFKPTEVLSSDALRGWVSDDELDQSATEDAFDLLYVLAGKRLARGLLTVVDATNVQKDARAAVVAAARKFHVLPVAIVLALPEAVCQERNAARTDRVLPPRVVRHQHDALRRSLKGLEKEGFRKVFVLWSPAEVEAVAIHRVPLWVDKRGLTGPFDIIGDVHGCTDELEELLSKLNYVLVEAPSDPVWGGPTYAHPEGRTAVFLGDLVDRGPRVLDTLRIVRNMVAAGSALCVPGNHDDKLLRALRGKKVTINHGLAETLAEIDALEPSVRDTFVPELIRFLDSLVGHYVLDGGRLVVAHAGMKQEYQGRASGKVRQFALYGDTTGETDDLGLPVRLDWAADYRGPATVVYGHVPVAVPAWHNRTVCLDTGCVFGGALTALRYPERKFVAVPARRVYCEPKRPLAPPASAVPDAMLDADDVTGKRRIETALRGLVAVRAENAAAALELMSRFAVDPRWLAYLPPTMSPCATSTMPGFLEHPAEAFGYFRTAGVGRVVCEEKHMGSRAVVVVGRTAEAVRERFGTDGGELGCIYTRTGRAFFNDAALEAAFLERARDGITAAGLWDELGSDWLILDAELLPWSAKAQELLKGQYAAVAAAGRAALGEAEAVFAQVAARVPAAEPELAALRERREAVDLFAAAYGRYCWPVNSLDDYKLAPFHLLASEGRVHADKPHPWHMDTLARLAAAEPRLFRATPCRVVDVNNAEEVDGATAWWLALTAAGGEGMVVKPFEFVARNAKGLVQPAVKCRGPEYLRIIYGPDYLRPANLDRLRSRGLARKRSLAASEFALGLEGLHRFVAKEPLRRVHECAFGVLALESEPLDPRL